MLSLIVAVSKNNGIGKDGKIPWHIPEDLKYFKEKTKNKTIIMGRKTFESLPKVLPLRHHIVLTRDVNYKNEDIEISTDIEETLNRYKNEPAFIIGGRDIYETALPYCEKLYITRVDREFEVDIFFPQIDYNDFELVEKSEIQVEESLGVEFVFEVWQRKG